MEGTGCQAGISLGCRRFPSYKALAGAGLQAACSLEQHEKRRSVTF